MDSLPPRGLLFRQMVTEMVTVSLAASTAERKSPVIGQESVLIGAAAGFGSWATSA
jgi:hypothetical protein